MCVLCTIQIEEDWAITSKELSLVSSLEPVLVKRMLVNVVKEEAAVRACVALLREERGVEVEAVKENNRRCQVGREGGGGKGGREGREGGREGGEGRGGEGRGGREGMREGGNGRGGREGIGEGEGGRKGREGKEENESEERRIGLRRRG